MQNVVDFLLVYAMSFVGTPYKYGGNTILDGGLDCSGYVSELLKAAGILRHRDDFSSQELYDFLTLSGVALGPGASSKPSPGAIAFYGKSPKKIEHVAFCIHGNIALSAAGGDSKTRTREDAMMAQAFVKPRPINYRKDLIAVIMPSYSP